jgi:endonuclease/exonuclease/phosphatase (EEP) superfamily protein YafD
MLALATLRFRWAAAGVCLALTLLNCWPLAPYMLSIPDAVAAPATPSIRLLIYNMHGAATDHDAFFSLIDRERPDALLLTEIPRDERALMEGLAARYSHTASDGSAPAFRIVLASRWPMSDWTVDHSVSPLLPVVRAKQCPSATSCFHVVALHAGRPLDGRARIQTAQLAVATRLAGEAANGRLVLAGDLNLTPWSPRFARLLTETGLDDSGLRRGLAPTWLWPFGLAIDHVLVGAGLVALDNHLGPELGSDHRPVIVDLAIRSN